MENAIGMRRVRRVRYELQHREVEVARVEALGPNFVTITFTGEALEGFASDSFDDHIKLMVLDAQGEPVGRHYTPRRFDTAARELTIEFARHGAGAASAWARSTRPGEPAIVAGPRGSLIIPTDYDWHLLAGDATALPAISRRLEELPANARAIVVALGEPGDRREFASRAQCDVRWVTGADAFLATLSALRLPSGEGFAWCAGEAAVMAKTREILLREHGLPKEAMRVAAYWKQGASSFHEHLE